uniref:MoaB/Mog domain-containing protein n=1 Tax=Pyramimonas obovata TaxID=1411642 RepID=A0A7S0QTF6_9CHLO|mmetsp:Transcript_14050/g.30034  ORF Transcript_14050/g.30034 Transcript_14050/m.30034 type:complete len:302 (+) Transcript_14050:143-1048(+)
MWASRVASGITRTLVSSSSLRGSRLRFPTRHVASIRCRPFCFSANSSSEQTPTAPKAAALIIGNEVLSGKVQDVNVHNLAHLLYARGVDLVRVEMVPDVKEDIISTVKSLSERVGPSGFVFTSGGIGPTHDDITYESVAEAFGETLAVHEGTRQRMTEHYTKQGKEVNDARLRMATLPTGCEALTTPGIWVPLVRLHNIYILPGIPRLFSAMLEGCKDRFTGPGMVLETVKTMRGEGEIADALRDIAAKFPDVSIGSYPRTEPTQDYTTKLCFEGRNASTVAEATECAKQLLLALEVEQEE